MSQHDFDFSEVLRRMVEASASDVHITAGFPPAIRDKGKIKPMEGFPVLTGQQTREVVYAILNDDQRKRFENQQAARLRLRDPRCRPLPCQLLLPARLGQRRLPPRAAGDPGPGLAGRAAGAARADRETARLRPRHRADRLGQEHDAGGDDRRDQRRARGPHPHDRGPDRVPAHAQALDRQPARGRLRRRRTSRSACALLCERTPTSSSSARCATWRRSPRR